MNLTAKRTLHCSLALCAGAFSLVAVFLVLVSDPWLIADNAKVTGYYKALAIICLVLFFTVSLILFFASLSSYRSEKALAGIMKMLDAYGSGDYSGRLDPKAAGRYSEFCDSVNALAQKLGQLEIMREDFLTNVSHDLKTPMTVIAGYVTNIMNGSIPKDSETHYLELVKNEIFRLSQLVGSLLNSSRIDCGNYELQITSFNICEAARFAIIDNADRIDAKLLDFSFECDEENMFVSGDYEEISLVLINLLDNAIKFAPDKGKVSINAYYVNRNVTVSVYNECEGIPEEDKPFIFDRFFKGDRTRGLDKDSFGLGLYVSRKIMEAHSSEILFDSEPGYCRFRFSLPVSEKTTSQR